MCRLASYYEAGRGWVTGVVGSQLGSQMGYPATPPEPVRMQPAGGGARPREMQAAEPRSR